MKIERLPLGIRINLGRYERYTLCANCEKPAWIVIGHSACKRCRLKLASKARWKGVTLLTLLTLVAGTLGLVLAGQRTSLSMLAYSVGIIAMYGVFYLLDVDQGRSGR